jgi:IS30 family transposase
MQTKTAEKTSANLWKWRNRAIGMLTVGCRHQVVVQQFNIHPSTISQLLSRSQVTWQVSARQRHRHQLKTTVRQDRFIVTTLRRNLFMLAPKVAMRKLVTSVVWSEDKWPVACSLSWFYRCLFTKEYRLLCTLHHLLRIKHKLHCSLFAHSTIGSYL